MVDVFSEVRTLQGELLAFESQDTALRDITDLVEKNILIKAGAGGRSTHYLLNW